MKPFIIINSKGNVELIVPFSYLCNEQDGPRTTACFADLLNAIGYDCIRYENALLYAGTHDNNDYRIFEIKMNILEYDLNDPYAKEQQLLDDVYNYTLGFPNHKKISFTDRVNNIINPPK